MNKEKNNCKNPEMIQASDTYQTAYQSAVMEIEKLKNELNELKNNKDSKIHTHSFKIESVEAGVLGFLTGKVNIYQRCRECGEVKVV